MGVAERLAGRRVLLTGVTGFVGEALLQRLLVDVPGCEVSLLVRPKGSATAEHRVRSLLRKKIFAETAEAAGGVDALLADRIHVLSGDLSAIPALPAGLDAVVHCAGDVSFDPPIDQAFSTNVVGVRNLLQRLDELGEDVHYVHVSTAYVAGRRRGSIPEGAVEHSVDADAELAWALDAARSVELRSRDSERLADFRAAAEREHRRAGMLVAASAAEEKRKQWVDREMVRLGTERARSLGWTDCYTFTKALGERVVEARAAGARVSILRPSIIESALELPYAGWIEGFKMAEPLILMFGRGEMPEFPGNPDTTIDIVPVDHVVAATVAVLAHPPEAGEAAYFHVASGSRNPLTLGHLEKCVRGYFEQHPFNPDGRGAPLLRQFKWPGAGPLEQTLRLGERAHGLADRALGHAPRSDRTRDLAVKLHRQGRRLENLRRYFDLYREYAEAELRFDDSCTLALFDSLDADDRDRFAFDTAVIDWDHYLVDVHCPAVTSPIRRLDDVRRGRRSRPTEGLAPVVAGAGGPVAFFDLDGTLLRSNVVETYLWMRLGELDGLERLAELGRVAVDLPRLLRAERHERSALLRSVYRRYRGARLADLEAIADEDLTSHVLSRLAPAAVRRIREHRAAGHTTVLVTGAIRPLTRPLAPLFDHVEAADLEVDSDGICTGFLASSPLVGEPRAAWVRSWARSREVDLADCFAYADSYSDLPLLEAVGHPVAVGPDIALFQHARRQHWPVADWPSPSASDRHLDPARQR